MRTRQLVALTLVVLAAHVWMFEGGRLFVKMPQAIAAKAMVTRVIEWPVVAEVVVEATATTPRVPPPQPSPGGGGSKSKTKTVPALRVAVPASTTLHYVVTSSRAPDVQGQARLAWTHDAASYDARLEVTAPLMPPRVMTSTGSITRDGLEPERFADKYRGERAAHFVRGERKVVFSSNAPVADLLPGAQDRLSVVMQLASLVAADPRKFRAGTAITLQTAGTRDADAWKFTVEGEESLQLPAGDATAIKLTRWPVREWDQRVEVWLFPAESYLPVRLRLTNPGGDWVDQQWSGTDRP